MNERAMTPEEEAVLNMELFKTEEIFRERVQEVITKELNNNASFLYSTIRDVADRIAQQKVRMFKDELARAFESQSPTTKINNINIY